MIAFDIPAADAFAAPPPELLSLLTADHKSAPRKAHGDNFISKVRRDGLPEGHRDDGITRVVGYYAPRYVLGGLSEDDFVEYIQQFNARHCSPPLDDLVVEEKARRFFALEREKHGLGERRPLRLLSRAELDSLPPVQWLIDGFLESASLAVLYGKYGQGKTFVGIDLACAIATGMSWNGRAVQRGAVAYVFAEGQSGARTRIPAWERYNTGGQLVEDLYVIPEPVNLMDAAAVASLVETLKERIADPVRLVVFDTWARTFAGDENHAADVNAAIANAGRIQRELGATVLVVAHPNKGGEDLRGSNSLPGAASTMLRVRKEDASGYVLEVEKQKEGERAPSLRYSLVAVPQAESCVVVYGGTAPEKPRRFSAGAASALEALRDLGPSSYTAWERASGAAKTTFNRYVGELTDAGAVVVTRVGTRNTYELAAGEPEGASNEKLPQF